MATIKQADFIQSVADALQYISHYHPEDFITNLTRAYELEQSAAAKDAMAQILINSRMCAEGHRPVCQDTGIVTAIISMGRSLRMKVVAEGVETQEELSFLQANQCEEAQGYYFSRPVLPQKLAKLLSNGKEARYRQLADATPEAILVHSEGSIVYANRAVAGLLRLRDPQIMSGGWLQQYVNPECQRALLAHRTGLLAASLHRSDGTSVYVEVAASPMTLTILSASMLSVPIPGSGSAAATTSRTSRPVLAIVYHKCCGSGTKMTEITDRSVENELSSRSIR